MPGPIIQRLGVAFEYPVYFTRDVFHPDNPDFASALSWKEPDRRHRVYAVIDRGVGDAWPDLRRCIADYAERHARMIELVAEPAVVEGGETVKSDPAAVEALQARLDSLGMDRQSFVVMVGGGGMLDMAGYASATTHRGVRAVRVPTTVLSQGDSALGVKNGINAFGKKNFIGTFAPPFAVLVDPRFLETLSERDTIAGMSEAVKVALIRDAAFFEWLRAHQLDLACCEPRVVERLVRRSAEIHLDHIARSGDPFEMGSARPLDFGHWAAHKLESLTRHRLRHGEAVAIGIAMDALYSVECGLCESAVAEASLALLHALGFRLWDDSLALADARGRPRVLDGLAEFREHLGGELTITLLRGIGEGVEVTEVREPLMCAVIERLRAGARG